jgi:hypothetical protein
MADREAKIERERIAAERRDAKRKPDLATAVANAFALLSPEGKAHVAAMAAYHLRGGVPR